MRGVVVEAAAALALLAPPGAALGLENDRAVGLAEDVGDITDRPLVEQRLTSRKAPTKRLWYPT